MIILSTINVPLMGLPIFRQPYFVALNCPAMKMNNFMNKCITKKLGKMLAACTYPAQKQRHENLYQKILESF
jgi:hypothetical protein